MKPFGGTLGTAIVLLSFAAQVILLVAFVQHVPGEKLGFASPGVLGVLIVAGWAILPGIVISLIRMLIAITKLKTDEDAKHRFAFYLLITFMPLTFVWRSQRNARPAPPKPERAKSAIQQKSDQIIAGRSWAQEAGISSEAACNKGTPDFAEGCKSYVRQWYR